MTITMENIKTEDELLELYYEHEKFIEATVLKRFNSPAFWELHGFTKDDLIQHGRIGLFEACKTYDSSKETSFRTYAISKIYWNISNECKKESLSKKKGWTFDTVERTSFDRAVDDSEGDVFTLHDTLASEGDDFYDVEMKQAIDNVLSSLTPRAAEVVKLKLEGFNDVQISNKIGISKQRVGQHLSKNKEKIKSILLEEVV